LVESSLQPDRYITHEREEVGTGRASLPTCLPTFPLSSDAVLQVPARNIPQHGGDGVLGVRRGESNEVLHVGPGSSLRQNSGVFPELEKWPNLSMFLGECYRFANKLGRLMLLFVGKFLC